MESVNRCSLGWAKVEWLIGNEVDIHTKIKRKNIIPKKQFGI